MMDRRKASGDSDLEARRVLKRRLSDVVHRQTSLQSIWSHEQFSDRGRLTEDGALFEIALILASAVPIPRCWPGSQDLLSYFGAASLGSGLAS